MEKDELQQRVKKATADHGFTASSPFARRLGDLVSREGRSLKWQVLLVAIERMGRLKRVAKDFLAPSTVGVHDGYVRLAWKSAKRELEFQATDPGWYITGTIIGPKDQRSYWEAECEPVNDATLRQCYRWWADEKAGWPDSRWLEKRKHSPPTESDEEHSAWKM